MRTFSLSHAHPRLQENTGGGAHEPCVTPAFFVARQRAGAEPMETTTVHTMTPQTKALEHRITPLPPPTDDGDCIGRIH